MNDPLTPRQAERVIAGSIGIVAYQCDIKALRKFVQHIASSDIFWTIIERDAKSVRENINRLKN